MRFVIAADMQPGSRRSFRFNPRHYENWQTARKYINELRPDLILIGGDVTRDGHFHDFEFEEMKTSLDNMNIPYRAIPGNMDTGNKFADRQGPNPNRDDIGLNMTSLQLKRFMKYFGEFPWSFVCRDIRFSGCYAAVAGSGLPEEEILWRWLEELKNLPPARHHIMINHYPLFINEIDEPNFDITKRESYASWYFSIDNPFRRKLFEFYKAAGVSMVFSGHIHCRRPVQIVDNIKFYKAPATAFAQWKDRWPDSDPTLGFYFCQVTEEGIDVEFIPLERESDAEGAWGIGGHTKPEDRDYSLALEK